MGLKKKRRHVATGRKGPSPDIATGPGAVQARDTAAPNPDDIESLVDQLREANRHLILAAIDAQTASDETAADASTVRLKLAGTMEEIWAKNEQLVAAASQARAMKEAAAQREEDYRRLSERLLDLQDEERRRLALELHDSMGQSLAALTMLLDLIGRTDDLSAQSRRALSECRSLADRCSKEVRTFAYLLHPPLPDQWELVSNLRRYVHGYVKRSGIRVNMDLGEIGPLPRAVETTLFRVVQESLANIHRHASAAEASIRLTAVSPDLVVLEISDRGHGLRGKMTENETEPRTPGVGIYGMKQRVRQVGGTFDVVFSKKGTTVHVTVPGVPA